MRLTKDQLQEADAAISKAREHATLAEEVAERQWRRQLILAALSNPGITGTMAHPDTAAAKVLKWVDSFQRALKEEQE